MTLMATPRRKFMPVVVDPDLPHQIQIHWASKSKQEVVAKCNCGWVGTVRRPETFGSSVGIIAEYEGHVAEATR